jgi:NAD+ synthase
MPAAGTVKQKKQDTRAFLQLDAAAEVERISEFLRTQLGEVLHRRGLVIAMSGGIDSSACAALAVAAVGPKRVFGLFMPERDSDPISLKLAKQLADQLGISYETQDIAPILEAAGCYKRRDDAIRRVVPEYGEGWASKIVLPGDRLDSDRLNVYYIAVKPPGGEIYNVRLSTQSYLEIVAATNFKQRVRKMLEYHHADRLHYAVMGSPNRLEYDQGFFVKGGDGLADVKPIAHLYKTQVYQIAHHLNVPEGITSRPPTTDTYSLPQSQEEFYFSLPALTMDLVLYALNHGWSVEEAAEKLELQPEQVQRAYADIEQKRSTTDYLHITSQLVEPVQRFGHKA